MLVQIQMLFLISLSLPEQLDRLGLLDRPDLKEFRVSKVFKELQAQQDLPDRLDLLELELLEQQGRLDLPDLVLHQL